MKAICLAIAVVMLQTAGFLAGANASTPGTVYLVVGSDTAIWNGIGTVDVYTRYPYYPQNSFTDSNAPIYQVMDPAWRSQFKDSFGQAIKFTWWMMGGSIYRDAVNLNVPLANSMTLHLMKQYHGAAIRQFGDELSLHYHTYTWSDYNGGGAYYWNQSRTFNELRSDFDLAIAQYLLEEGVFPVSFRSGWHFMDQDWQQYLNQLIPFCFHDNYPTKVAWYTNAAGPVAGVEDWSRAPSAFVPFHPATNDYQSVGTGAGWNVRSVKTQSLTQTIVDQMFGEASNGVDQVACFWDHLPENFVANITNTCALIARAAAKNPNVRFRYCTAVEAMQRWLGQTNQVPPQLGVLETAQASGAGLVITSSVPIFQERPFVCLRDIFQRYYNLTPACVPAGSNAWTVDLGLPTNLLAKVAVAVTENVGNLATYTLRFVPDDVYLDNRDPEYLEEQGTWSSTSSAAWGTDARLMLLGSNSVARAAWRLPVETSGRYLVSVQVPALTNAATNVSFYLGSGITNLLSVTLPQGITTNQWTFVGSAVFDPALSNWVEMAVNGAKQPGAYALADVLRMVPGPDGALPEIVSNQPIGFLSLPGRYLLGFIAQAGTNYSVQRASALTEPWSTLQLVSPSQSGRLEFEDERPPTGQAFYRVLAQ